MMQMTTGRCQVHVLLLLLVRMFSSTDAFILTNQAWSSITRTTTGTTTTDSRGWTTKLGYAHRGDDHLNGKNTNSDGGEDASMLDELSWRAAKIRLEDAHTQSFLRRKPLKLRYTDARRWVQANLGAATKDEFKDMVANGNVRTPYIPKNPSTYYRETGDWISWDHFLNGVLDEDASRITPYTGKFD
jgi:hypothetical protein